jgi:hypothetical protein
MKKPNYQSVIASVCIFDTIAASRSSASLITMTMNSPEERPLFEEPSSPIGRTQSGLEALFVTPSQKNDGDGNQLVTDEPFIDKKKPSSTTFAKGYLNNGEHTLIPVMAKMIHSAVWEYPRVHFERRPTTSHG